MEGNYVSGLFIKVKESGKILGFLTQQKTGALQVSYAPLFVTQ